MGRKNVVIRRIENKAARDVCFSKRRNGLFSKANDLAVMCGAEVVAIVHSPAGKAFSFAHPSAEDIINRFLPAPEQAGAAGAGTGAAVDRDRLEELQQKYNNLGAELGAVEHRKERWGEATAKDRAEGSQAAAWLDAVADQHDMGDADMLACMAWLREAQVTVAACVNQVLQGGRRDKEAALAALPQQLLAGGGGFEFGGTSVNGGTGQMMTIMPTPGFAVGGGFELGGTSANGGIDEMMTAIAGGGGFELGGTSVNGGTEQMVMVMPTPGFVGGEGFEPGGTSANGWMEEMMTAIAGVGGFELGGTSVNGGMEENFHQQQMMTAMPQLPGLAGGYGFEFGGTSADGGMYEMIKQQQMMMAMPPPPGFAAGMEIMQQQTMPGMPTPPGFAAGMEMQQQQQQTMTALPPLPVFAAGTEMMQQQESGPHGSFPNREEDEDESETSCPSPTESIHSAASTEGRAWLRCNNFI